MLNKIQKQISYNFSHFSIIFQQQMSNSNKLICPGKHNVLGLDNFYSIKIVHSNQEFLFSAWPCKSCKISCSDEEDVIHGLHQQFWPNDDGDYADKSLDISLWPIWHVLGHVITAFVHAMFNARKNYKL